MLQRLEKGGEGLDQRHQKVEEAIKTLNAKIEGMKSVVDGTRQAMSNDLDKTKEDLRKFAVDVRAAMSAGSGISGTTSLGKSSKLVTTKETTVDKLPESISKSDFSNWIEELYVHLDGVEGWACTSNLLKEI